MVVVITGLTCVALFVVRQTVQQRAQEELTISAHNSLMALELLQHQRHLVLSRKAGLLATSAFLSDGDVSSFTESIENPLDTSGCDLMALADSRGKIVALHTTHSGLPAQPLELLLRTSLLRDRNSDWWFYSGRLYQVEFQSIRSEGKTTDTPSATVIVGQELDERGVRELGNLLSSEVAVRYQGRVVASSLDPYRESELASQLQENSRPKQVHLGAEKFFASTVELTRESSSGPSLLVFRSESETTAFLDRLNQLLLRVGLLAVVVGGFLAFLISETFTRPLGKLVEGVRALERGDYSFPLEAQGGGEVAAVTKSFDRMRRTLQHNDREKHELEEQLRQSQKMEALGRLAGGVAHDFNNLLTIIRGHSDLLLDWLQHSEAPYKSSEQIHKAADRATALTRQLLAFSRKQVLQPKVLDLNILLAEMDKLLERLIREDVEFHFLPGTAIGKVKADPGQIEQVVMNLVVNACDAMPKGGKLTIETRNVNVDTEYLQGRPGLQAGSFVLLSSTDTGQGMDQKTKARIFEPFFTTKEVGKGTGLGLATVYGIVKQSGGFVYVQSAVGKGTCFEIYFPHVAATDETTQSDRPSPARVLDAPTVLVVEDDQAVRDLTTSFLNTAGYQVLSAKDGFEALQLAKECGDSIAVLLTDVVMPKMRGTELAKRLRADFPATKVIFVSGYLEHNQEGAEILAYGVFLEKPFTRESLLNQVNEVLLANGKVYSNSPQSRFENF